MLQFAAFAGHREHDSLRHHSDSISNSSQVALITTAGLLEALKVGRLRDVAWLLRREHSETA